MYCYHISLLSILVIIFNLEMVFLFPSGVIYIIMEGLGTWVVYLFLSIIQVNRTPDNPNSPRHADWAKNV